MNTKLIYVPTMHEALLPAKIPDDVLLLDPGLSAINGDSRHYTPPDLPFTGGQAKAMLAEMLDLGRGLASGGELTNLAGVEQLARQINENSSTTRGEALALRHFAQSGRAPARRDEPCGLRPEDILKAAQKVLLLAWELEQNSLDIIAAEDLVEQSRNGLKLALGEDAGGDSPDQAEHQADRRIRASLPGANWRAMLEAAAVFLPEDAVLVSAHAELRAELMGTGLLNPLPEDAAEVLSGWSADLLSELLWVNLPLWRMLGFRRPPDDRPALSKVCEMVVLRA